MKTQLNFPLSLVFLLGFLLAFLAVNAQPIPVSATAFEPTPRSPYGSPNPDAPAAIRQFSPMIGTCDCESKRRKKDGEWEAAVPMTWRFKYILNGHAVQDEVWEADRYATSIRQYESDSARWVITYFSDPGVTAQPGVWTGGRQGDSLVFRKPYTPPNGMQGASTLIFHQMTDAGFHWDGIWISDDGNATYPFWEIRCKKRHAEGG
ncbi:MAG: hypothetical protein AAF570_09235 [Bacteroidota bacterium]